MTSGSSILSELEEMGVTGDVATQPLVESLPSSVATESPPVAPVVEDSPEASLEDQQLDLDRIVGILRSLNSQILEIETVLTGLKQQLEPLKQGCLALGAIVGEFSAAVSGPEDDESDESEESSHVQ